MKKWAREGFELLGRVKYLSLFVFVAVLTPATALASGGGGLSALTLPTINFVVYAAIVVYLYRKYGAPALSHRSIQIQENLRISAEEIAQAREEIASVNARFENVEAERTEIRHQLKAEGKKIAESVLIDAKRSAERIAQDVKRQIESELNTAQKECRTRVIEKASTLARQKLVKGITPEDDKRIREEALTSLFGAGN